MEDNRNHLSIDESKYTALRREFHKIPEIGFKEHETVKLILSTLKSIPLFDSYAKITYVGETGFFIDISGQCQVDASSTVLNIALRADIDGLPFQEESSVPYKSTHNGRIHGCGHDGHMTVLIATLEYIITHITQLPKTLTIRFIFQPAEELSSGAKSMIEGGCLDSIHEIYGLHTGVRYNVGQIGVIKGVLLARIDAFTITIKGKGGHSSIPARCLNPINSGVQIITAINKISQEIEPDVRHAIGIGSFRSGEAGNVIPDYAVIKGTVRSLENEIGEKIMARITEICENIAKMNHCEVNVDSHYDPTTVNHDKETEYVEDIAKKYFQLNTNGLPVMGSEDFCYYLQKVPGCFFYLGVVDEEHMVYLHSPKFDFNDKAIKFGVEAFLRIIETRANIQLIQ